MFARDLWELMWKKSFAWKSSSTRRIFHNWIPFHCVDLLNASTHRRQLLSHSHFAALFSHPNYLVHSFSETITKTKNNTFVLLRLEKKKLWRTEKPKKKRKKCKWSVKKVHGNFPLFCGKLSTFPPLHSDDGMQSVEIERESFEIKHRKKGKVFVFSSFLHRMMNGTEGESSGHSERVWGKW